MIDNALAYARAIHPERVTIAGVSLKPFAIGHAILLTARRSPIARMWSGDDDKTKDMRVHIGDAALALWICERPATEAFTYLGRWRTAFRLKRLARAVKAHGAYEVISALVEYVASGFQGPKIRPQTGDGSGTRLCGMPMLAMLHAGRKSHFHENDAEALNTPLSAAFWQRAAVLEEKGLIRVWTDEDEELVDYARKLASDPERIKALFPDQADEAPKPADQSDTNGKDANGSR